MAKPKTTEQEKVFNALENGKYKWRTIKGVAKELHLSPQVVQSIINRNEEQIVRSSILGENGEVLYTTRRHFKEKSSFTERIKAAFRNRMA